MNNYYFTIFTPTFNRKHLLTRVFESLNTQTLKNFEWLIIDDGSTDGTKDLIIEIQGKATFPIIYEWVSNRGKHKVTNLAVHKARGKFFIVLDSDDWLESNALDRFKFHWETIPLESRHQFSGVAGLSKYGNGVKGISGKLNGIKNPQDILDTDMISIREKFKVRGEKCGCHLTSVMKEFPFPEFTNEKFSPEIIVWRRMAEKYKVRYVNEIYRNVEVQKGGLSDPKIILKRNVNNANGLALRFNEETKVVFTFLKKLKASINYTRFSLHADISLSQIYNKCLRKSLLIISLPIAIFFYIIDKRRLKHSL